MACWWKLPPKTCEPVAFARLASIIGRPMRNEMTWIERRCELPQRELFTCPLRSFKQDDGPAAMGNLWQLKFAQMIPKRSKCGRKISYHARAGNTGFPLNHRTGS